MLCHFGQTWSSYVATLFILCCSTATNSATGDYIAVPERHAQNEEPAGENEERTGNKPSLFPKRKVDSIDALAFQTGDHDFSFILFILFQKYWWIEFYNVFPIKEYPLMLCLYYYLLRRRGNKHFDVCFLRIKWVRFPSKDGKDAAYDGKNGWKGDFSRQTWHFFLRK